jgi:hypothetical protein
VDRQRRTLELSKPHSAREDNQGSVLFIIDSEQRLVIAKFGECLTGNDIESYAQSLRTDPRFDSSFSEIADISDVKELPLESSDFLKLADRIDPFSIQSKRAFVAQSAVQKHAARMHKILRSQKNFEIFETLEEAERWISRTE